MGPGKRFFEPPIFKSLDAPGIKLAQLCTYRSLSRAIHEKKKICCSKKIICQIWDSKIILPLQRKRIVVATKRATFCSGLNIVAVRILILRGPV